MRMPRLFANASLAALACAAAATPALSEEAAGRWAGQLPAPVGLHIVLTITKGADGGYAGALQSPDQGDQQIPATRVEATADRLTFSQADLHLSYEAHWDPAKAAWVGVFNQGGQASPLELSRADTPAATSDPLPHSPLLPAVEGLDGDWSGKLDLGPQKLRVVLHVIHQDKGVKAGFDSPDQGAAGIPVTAIGRAGDVVTFTVAAADLTFKGALSPDGHSLTGTFTQGGHDLPLTLERSAPETPAAAKPHRPQEEAIAAAPVPYRQEEVAFDNPGASGVRLAGTLTLPQGKGPFPTVVLISGSGRNARDETVADHRIFLVLADHLTRQGLAVLRYDKRGAGQSKGDYARATTADFASDATAAVAYLRARPEIDPRRLGLVGHSEGGLIAPMVAVKDSSLAFIVLMAGPGVPGRILVAEQERLIGVAEGEPKAEADGTYAVTRRLYDAVATARDGAEAQARARKILAAADPKPPQPIVDDLVKRSGTDWFRFFLAFDPVPVLRHVRVPVLVLNGSNDLQVPPAIDLPPIRKALAKNPDVTIVEMPGLNHLFQRAATGSPLEYGRIEETLAPELLQTISDWIGTHVR